MLDFNKDENLILSTSRDGTSKLWEFKDYFEYNRYTRSLQTFSLPENFLMEDINLNLRKNLKGYFTVICQNS